MKIASFIILGMLAGSLLSVSTAYGGATSFDLLHPKGVTIHFEFPDGRVTGYVKETVEGVDVYVFQCPSLPPDTNFMVPTVISVPDGVDVFMIVNGGMEINGNNWFPIEARTFNLMNTQFYRVVYYPYTPEHLYFTVRGTQNQEDLDGDGVADDVDDCLESEIVSPFTKLEVDAYGCTPHQNIDKILELYGQLNLDGHIFIYGDPANGPKVNVTDLFAGGRVANGHKITTFDGKDVTVETTRFLGGIVCSEYQLGILKWLDLMRRSNTKIDPSSKRTYGDLFNGVNYGPISSGGGAHLAVVIYPTQSDWPNNYGWTTNGTVLDPWYHQQMMYFSSIAWILFNPFAAPYQLTKIPGYPITGGSYASSESDEKEMRQRRVEYIKNRKHNGYVHCKVDLRITDTDTGNRLGVFDDQFLREIPDSDLIFIPLGGDENDKVWSYSLPEGNYTLEIVGKADDDFHLMTEYNDQGLFEYQTNFTPSGGVSTKKIVPKNGATPLMLSDGTEVNPTPLTPTMVWLPLLQRN